MLNLGYFGKKKKKSRRCRGLERATAHFGSSVMTEKIMSR